jgi:CTP synthase (UTP-ammonia lyase)
MYKESSLALNLGEGDASGMTESLAMPSAQTQAAPLPAAPARIALVGDRSPHVRAHARIPVIIEALRRRDGLMLDAYWIPTEDAAREDLGGFDAIWLTPGSPYRSAEGAIAAARAARERAIPFLGTCGGFQHAVVEFARDVCGLDVGHAEYLPGDQRSDRGKFLIIPLACSLVGHEDAVRITPGSLAERILGAERTIERYHCSFGLNPDYLGTLSEHGLRFTGHDENGQVRIAELPGHPFFLGTLFQPELAGDGTRPHPIAAALAAAAVARAAAGTPAAGTPAAEAIPAGS